MAARGRAELHDGEYVTLASACRTYPGFLPMTWNVVLHSENGILGTGPPRTGRRRPGPDQRGQETVYGPHPERRSSTPPVVRIIRGATSMLPVLGAMQVSNVATLSNWGRAQRWFQGNGRGDGPRYLRPGRVCRASGAPRGKTDPPDLLSENTLPYIRAAGVNRIITDRRRYADVNADGLVLVERPPGLCRGQVPAATGAR